MSSLQELIDELAAELGRPVGIDDRRFRALAYSSHGEEVDQVRRDSILRREAPQAVTSWLFSLGIEGAEGHVRVPANAEFGMDARLCFPLRFEGATLGYLWLIDQPAVDDPRSLELAGQYAEQLAAELVRVRRLENADREQQARALLALLADGDAGAAAELTAAGILTGNRSFVVAVVQVSSPSGEDGAGAPLGFGPEVDVHLSLAAEEVRRGISSNHALVVTQPHAAIMALGFEDAEEPLRRGAALLEACRRHLGSAPAAVEAGAEPAVGIGAPRPALSDLPGSYREARLALEVGRRVPAIDTAAPVVWEDLGAYRSIATLLGDRDPVALLPAPVVTLLADRDAQALVETAELYLDRGGDAKGTADALFLHRSSLYKRLHRIERLTGYDLRQGDDRLELHLGLRLWRLGGRQSSPPPS